MSDTAAISQVVLKERQARDRGWFDQEARCFHEDSRVRVSWFDGPGAEFVRRSRDLFAEGVRPTHRMSPPVVHVGGDRAVVEAPAEITVLHDFAGVRAYVVGYVRLLYRLLQRDAWKITFFDCIYERDTLVPVVHGEQVDIDPAILARFRQPYRYLGYHLYDAGSVVRDDLFGDDRPHEVEALYREAFAWMRRTDGE
ncbi:nuclear transport factor 2 family protein [Amycolatopsis sp. NBC_00345]|uniref:nuclear transport factor 2 family protein n=1 Tax=Amycolatopsis sp. NBC_00345 TaxID=2975955 RepID=UPI002E2524AE